MRLNLHDTLFSDSRFHRLCSPSMLGDMDKAIGRLVRLWFLGQKYWIDGEKLIPPDEFEIGDFDECLKVGLVRKEENGYYACGSSKHFQWIKLKLASAVKAGLASAEARKIKYGTALPNNATNNLTESEQNPNVRSEDVERALNERLTKPNAPTPTPTPTPNNNTYVDLREADALTVSDETAPVSTFKIHDLWNKACSGGIKTVTRMSVKRIRRCKTLLKQHPDEGYWIDLIARVNASEFCRGEGKGRDGSAPWVATFDWFLKEDSQIKIAEGNYDSAKKPVKVIQFAENLRGY